MWEGKIKKQKTHEGPDWIQGTKNMQKQVEKRVTTNVGPKKKTRRVPLLPSPPPFLRGERVRNVSLAHQRRVSHFFEAWITAKGVCDKIGWTNIRPNLLHPPDLEIPCHTFVFITYKKKTRRGPLTIQKKTLGGAPSLKKKHRSWFEC